MATKQTAAYRNAREALTGAKDALTLVHATLHAKNGPSRVECERAFRQMHVAFAALTLKFSLVVLDAEVTEAEDLRGFASVDVPARAD
jgi:hypothetical protein